MLPLRSKRSPVLWAGLALFFLAVGLWLRLDAIGRLAPRTSDRIAFDGRYYYLSAAEALLEGRGIDPSYNHREPPPPYFIPPPLNAVFIAGVFWILKTRDAIAVCYAQLAINLLTGALLAGLLWRIGGRAAALAGFAGWMLYPEFFAYTVQPLTENNYFFLMSATLLLVAAWSGGGSWRWAMAAAAVLGLANLQRPTAMFLGFPLAAYALFRFTDGRRWIHAAIFACVPFLVLLPWMIRNLRLTGDPVWVSSNGGILFYAVNHKGYDPIATPLYGTYPDRLWMRADLSDPGGPRFEGRMTAYRLSGLYMAEARRDIVERPGEFLKNLAIKFGQRFLLVPGVFKQTEPSFPEGAARAIYYVLLAMGLAGLAWPFSGWRSREHQALALCFAYYALFAALMHDDSVGRISSPLRVFLLLFAALFLAAAARRLGSGEPEPAQAREAGIDPNGIDGGNPDLDPV